MTSFFKLNPTHFQEYTRVSLLWPVVMTCCLQQKNYDQPPSTMDRISAFSKRFNRNASSVHNSEQRFSNVSKKTPAHRNKNCTQISISNLIRKPYRVRRQLYSAPVERAALLKTCRSGWPPLAPAGGWHGLRWLVDQRAFTKHNSPFHADPDCATCLHPCLCR